MILHECQVQPDGSIRSIEFDGEMVRCAVASSKVGPWPHLSVTLAKLTDIIPVKVGPWPHLSVTLAKLTDIIPVKVGGEVGLFRGGLWLGPAMVTRLNRETGELDLRTARSEVWQGDNPPGPDSIEIPTPWGRRR